jgi:hypothetical protein
MTQVGLALVLSAGSLVSRIEQASSLQTKTGKGSASQAFPTGKLDPEPLTSRAIIRVLLANKDIPLRGIASCESVKHPGDKTTGDYVATVFSRLAEPGILWRTESTFRRLGSSEQKRWRIRLSLLGTEAGEVFDTGVTFDYDEKTAKLIKGSFQCSGTF